MKRFWGRELKILAFDADRVIIVPAHRFMADLEQKLHAWPELSGVLFRGAFQDCLGGEAELEEAIAPFLPRWGWHGGADEFIRIWFEVEPRINEPLIEVVQALRRDGFRCVVATNQERRRLACMREEEGFSRLFDGVFGSAEVGAVKPARGFYEGVTGLLNVEPGDIAFWNDSEANVEGARAFGWRAEQFTDMDGFLESLNFHLGWEGRRFDSFGQPQA